jgi:hypothetical protein
LLIKRIGEYILRRKESLEGRNASGGICDTFSDDFSFEKNKWEILEMLGVMTLKS